MQGHTYVALRVLTIQNLDGTEAKVLPGELVPREVSDTWSDSAVRAMRNVKHIEFARVAEGNVLPYLSPPKPAPPAEQEGELNATDKPVEAPPVEAPPTQVEQPKDTAKPHKDKAKGGRNKAQAA